MAAEPDSPNLLPHGGFEQLDAAGWPVGWKPAEKYTYFPPGAYYLFNSWHNDGFANRGAPAVDKLVLNAGRQSLRVPALAGDEIAVASEPIKLAQEEPRLIEVSAWVKIDRANQIQIDARDERASASTASTSSPSRPRRSAPTSGGSFRQVSDRSCP